MATGNITGINYLSGVFTGTTIFGLEWILSLILTLLTLLILTREYNKWRELALPVMIIWHIVGITPNLLMYLGAGIIYVIDKVSIQTLGSVISAIKITPKRQKDELKRIMDSQSRKSTINKAIRKEKALARDTSINQGGYDLGTMERLKRMRKKQE